MMLTCSDSDLMTNDGAKIVGGYTVVTRGVNLLAVVFRRKGKEEE
jgi:hypothetical protein